MLADNTLEEWNALLQENRKNGMNPPFRSFRFKFLPTWPNDTPFRRKDCRESILLSNLSWNAQACCESLVRSAFISAADQI